MSRTLLKRSKIQKNQQLFPSDPPLKKNQSGGRKIGFFRRTGNERYHQTKNSSGKIYKTKITCFQQALCTATGSLTFSRESSFSKRIIFKRNLPRFEAGWEIKPFSNELAESDIGSGDFINYRRISNLILEGASTEQTRKMDATRYNRIDTTSESGGQEHVGKRSHSKGV